MTDKSGYIMWTIVAGLCAVGLSALALCASLSDTAAGWALAGTCAAALAACLTGALKKMRALHVLAMATALPLALAGTLGLTGCAPVKPSVNWPCVRDVVRVCAPQLATCIKLEAPKSEVVP